MLCIVANTIVLSLEWYGESKSYQISLENMNFIFAMIFAFEVSIKIVGYGSRMIKDSWNIFDIVIVATTLIGIIITNSSHA